MSLVKCLMLVAQTPILPAGSPGYLFTPPPTQPGVYFDASSYQLGLSNISPFCYFQGNAYRLPHVTTVYGVAVAGTDLEKLPYLWVRMMQERVVDSSSCSYCYAIDTVWSGLYCFIEQAPVHYGSFRFLKTSTFYPDPPYGPPDTGIVPFYEFYFPSPIEVPENTRFYVGIENSGYNQWNHLLKDTFYCPYGVPSRGITFYKDYDGVTIEECDDSCLTRIETDGLDSVWGIVRNLNSGLVNWACHTCTELTPIPFDENFTGRKYECWGYFPIVRPPEDSSRIHPLHTHPLRPQAVQNFRLTELDSAHAVFAWDTMEPSDWGPVIGINADRYQINYAPYTQEYDEADTLGIRADGITLRMNFDSTVMYKARCRTRSRHVCDIHDTVVYGDWSEEVYFHTGVGVPDTAPLVCPNVVGLRYVGLWGGFPKFEWSRCPGHSNYDVQLAHAGRDDWHRVDLTSENNTMLRSGVDPTERYWLRVRAECNHHCHIHDTVMRSQWSDTLEFCLTPQGVDEAEGGGLRLVPNPAHDEVTLTAETAITRVAVYDMQGHLVLEQQAHGREVTLSLRKLAAGSYIVHADTPRGRLTHKLTVE